MKIFLILSIILLLIYYLFFNYEFFDNNLIKVNAIVAKTNKEIQKGLMFRKKPLSDNEGMIFLMPIKNNHLMNLSNVYIPLDVIYIDKTKHKNKFKIIGFYKNRIPLDDFFMSIGQPSDYVLEMNAGWLDKNNLDKEDIIYIDYHV